MLSRFRIVSGGSRLLGQSGPLQFRSATLPPGNVWDHDGTDFLYVWLPSRSGNTEVNIYIEPPLARTGVPDF